MFKKTLLILIIRRPMVKFYFLFFCKFINLFYKFNAFLNFCFFSCFQYLLFFKINVINPFQLLLLLKILKTVVYFFWLFSTRCTLLTVVFPYCSQAIFFSHINFHYMLWNSSLSSTSLFFFEFFFCISNLYQSFLLLPYWNSIWSLYFLNSPIFDQLEDMFFVSNKAMRLWLLNY